MAAVIEEFKAVEKNALRSFARVCFPGGLVTADISVHVSHGHGWSSPPSRPMVDRDDGMLRDREGKIRYQPLITFSDKNRRDAWSAAIVQALHNSPPDAVHDALPGAAA